LGGWFRFREIPEGYRALILAAIVGGSVLFAFFKRRFNKAVPRTSQVEISESEFTILGPDARVALPWSAFSQSLESPDLFVLVDRPKQTLIVIPKRAFPSESWQTWFREQAAKPLDVMTPDPSEYPALAWAASADRIALTIRLRFRDYLDRTLASWRTWAI